MDKTDMFAVSNRLMLYSLSRLGEYKQVLSPERPQLIFSCGVTPVDRGLQALMNQNRGDALLVVLKVTMSKVTNTGKTQFEEKSEEEKVQRAGQRQYHYYGAWAHDTRHLRCVGRTLRHACGR